MQTLSQKDAETLRAVQSELRKATEMNKALQAEAHSSQSRLAELEKKTLADGKKYADLLALHQALIKVCASVLVCWCPISACLRVVAFVRSSFRSSVAFFCSLAASSHSLLSFLSLTLSYFYHISNVLVLVVLEREV